MTNDIFAAENVTCHSLLICLQSKKHMQNIHFSNIEQNKFNNNVLFKKIIEQLNLRSNSALSKVLMLDRQTASGIRLGKKNIGATLLIRIHETTGMSITEIKEIMIGSDNVS